MCLIDFSKAYNRQCHNRLLTCYSDLGTPSHLLKILHSYLQNRRMRVRYKGETSNTYDLPGSGPQGTNIGILSFVVYINSCGVPLDGILDCISHEHKEQYIGHPVQENEAPPKNNLGWVKICHPVLPTPNPHISENEARFKYCDDKVLAEAVDLNNLRTFNEPLDRPLNYRDRTSHYLPKESCILQTRIAQVSQFCKVQQMIVNPTKSKTAIFSTSLTKDFYPRISNNESSTFENTEEFDLLGVNFVSHPKSGLKWETYISKCIKRGYSNLWILKRLVEFGVPIQDVLMTYCERVRVHVEQHIPLWTFSISNILSDKIEKLQKSAVYIMLPLLGSTAQPDYQDNLALMGLEKLEKRRNSLSHKFARKVFKHPEHSKMFQINGGRVTRTARRVIVPPARSSRYDRSTIPSLAKILNSF